MLVEPGENRRHLAVLVAQLVHQLDGERVRQRHAFEFGKDGRHGLRRPRARAQQSVRHLIGLLPRNITVGDPAGDAPQVFDQHDTQCN